MCTKYRESRWEKLHLTFQSDSLFDLGTVKLLPLHLLVEKLEVPTAQTERNQKGRSEGEKKRRGEKGISVDSELISYVQNDLLSSNK